MELSLQTLLTLQLALDKEMHAALFCFLFFINELEIEIINNGRHGSRFLSDAYELFILLLADDVILFAETVVGLQPQLNNLHRAAPTLQLKVNMSKSNIIVFRKGGYFGSREKRFYNGETVPEVNIYRYLWLFFSAFKSCCLKDIASRAKDALLCIMQKLHIPNKNSFKLFIKFYDAQIQPIVQYGAEIWGLDKSAAQCESVHLFALKKILLRCGDVDTK